ncbi:MAG: hypothetical protein IKW80_10325 [Thermoguttaceae bacterium]|nr:hypothetical protein [Thermoguttaceae bacterium]
MLLTISTGKKPTGAAHRPSPTAMALAGYLLTLTAATTLTLRRLAAEIDRDARSCRTAAEQLIAFGVEGLTWTDADTLTFRPTTLGAADIRPAESVPIQTWDVPVESWEEEFVVEREPVDEQLSLFGGAAPVRPESELMTMAASAVRRPAAVDIDVETDDESDAENPGVIGADPVKTRMGGFVLDDGAANIDVDPANLAQSLHKPCTEIVQDVQKAGHGALAAAMERLAATLDGKPGNISAHADAPAPTHAPASKEKQELILNQSTNVNQEALNHEFKLLIAHPKIVPRFDAAERERRIAEIREKVPDAAEHVVGTLANMMAFGTMPESVFYGALTDAAAPTVRNHGAFLNAKVQRLKREYRWNQTLLGDGINEKRKIT